MRCFISYAHEDRGTAELISARLAAEGHSCFFDESSLPTGAGYDGRIRREIRRAHVFIFLISPRSVQEGRYTKTELKLAQEKWPRPEGRVIPVVIEATPRDAIPAYLRAQKIVQPDGDVVAEIVNEVYKLQRRRFRFAVAAAAFFACTAGIGAGVVAWRAHRDVLVKNEPPAAALPYGPLPAKPNASPAPTDATAIAKSATAPSPNSAPPDRSRAAKRMKVPRETDPPEAAFLEGTRKLPAQSIKAESFEQPLASPLPLIRPEQLAVRFRFFDQRLMVLELAIDMAKIDTMAQAKRWKAARDAVRSLADERDEPRLWLAEAQIYANWDFPTYREQAEVLIRRAKSKKLAPEVAEAASSIGRSLVRQAAE